MIYISKIENDSNSITIKVDGRLDRSTLDPLTKICDPYLKFNKEILLDLEGLTHTDESGRAYIKSLKNKNLVKFLKAPKFLNLDFQP